MILRRAFLVAGVTCLVAGMWLAWPLARAAMASQLTWGRVIDVVVVPTDDERVRLDVIFEYLPLGGDGQTLVQGRLQADGALRVLADSPVLTGEQARRRRQDLLARPQRRVVAIDGQEPAIVVGSGEHGWDFRDGQILAVVGGLMAVIGLLRRRSE
jgi:hypothetical protein